MSVANEMTIKGAEMNSPFAIEQENGPSRTRRKTSRLIGRGALAVFLPGVTAEDLADREDRRRLVLICSATALLMVAVVVAFFVLQAQQSKTSQHAATRFATAVVHDQASLAPAGGSAYVERLRAYFGPVTSATVIATHNHEVNTGDVNEDRTYYVADLLLQTRRGPAVVELAFDNQSLSSERISAVRELKPGEASGLPATERKPLASAFAARGGRAFGTATLSAPTASSVSAQAGSAAPLQSKRGAAPVAATAPAVHASPQLTKAAKQLNCVRDAHGDVAKLQQCAS